MNVNTTDVIVKRNTILVMQKACQNPEFFLTTNYTN